MYLPQLSVIGLILSGGEVQLPTLRICRQCPRSPIIGTGGCSLVVTKRAIAGPEVLSVDGGPSPAAYAWPAFQEDNKRCMWVSMWVTCMGISNIGVIAREAEKAKGTDAPLGLGRPETVSGPQNHA